MNKVKTFFKLSLSSALITTISLSAGAQTDAGSDIFVASVNYEMNNTDTDRNSIKISLSDFQQITDTASYTNQPYFINDDNEIAYTQSLELDGTSQMDTFIYNFASKSSKNLTNSDTSEYSPTPTPDGKGLSTIRVNAEGKQELWYLALDKGSAKRNLLPAIEPVGYHVWIDPSNVLLFVLGEPHTLRLAKVDQETDQGRVLDTRIGPSLWSIPETDLFSYSKELNDSLWQLRSVDPKTKTSSALVDMPKGSYYYAWSPQGYAVTAVESKLYQWKYNSSDKTNKWTQFADLDIQCSAGISRLVFSQRGDKIALVCNRVNLESEE
jgi:Tol biopolymer transport system component